MTALRLPQVARDFAPHAVTSYGAAPAEARALAIVLHGVGALAATMAPVATALAARPGMRVLALDAPDPFEGGGPGRQWFSIRGVTEANRSTRVDAILPPLLSWIEAERVALQLPRIAVTLAGFSQGAILALAAAARGYRCGEVIALSGRLVRPITQARVDAPRILIVHGSDDKIIAASEAAFAQCQLGAAGFHVDVRLVPGMGHNLPIDLPTFLAGGRSDAIRR